MDNLTFLIIPTLLGVTLGIAFVNVIAKASYASMKKQALSKAEMILRNAENESEAIKKSAQIKGKELTLKHKKNLEKEIQHQKKDFLHKEKALIKKEQAVEEIKQKNERYARTLQKKEHDLERKQNNAEQAIEQAQQASKDAETRLETVAALTAEQAQKELKDSLLDQAKQQVFEQIKTIEDDATKQATEKAQTIIATTIQRYASEFVHEATVTVIPLASDNVKGQLIGREGRNVRAIESTMGVDLIIDDTPEVITISCFNPIRREIARIAIESLITDGRIHPTKISAALEKAKKDIHKIAIQKGEQAVFDLGIHRIHNKLVHALGELSFRQSHGRNVLHHSMEVSYITGLMAAELGINEQTARRVGLLHDIGKITDQTQEGPHAQAGAAFAKKHKESSQICQAIASHHGDVPPKSALDHILMAANELANTRPGASHEQLASYIKRLEDLETLCKDHQGVKKVFAMSSGREVHVLVESDKIDDVNVKLLSQKLAAKIEAEAVYPGQVQVVVLREIHSSHYAK